MIPHDWYMSFEKFGGLPTMVTFEKINLKDREASVFQSMSPNEFGEVPHTIGCKTPLGIAVFDFNSSPIANAVKNSFGLWDFKIS